MTQISDTNVILELTRQAIADLDNGDVKLSAVLRSAIRIARLSNDPVWTWRLEKEMIDIEDEEARDRARNEAYAAIPRDRFDKIRERIVEDYIDERSMTGRAQRSDTEPSMWGQSVPYTEIAIAQLEQDVTANRTARQIRLEQGHPLGVFQDQSDEETLVQLRIVFERIRQRVHDYLTRVEQRLVFSQINTDIFGRYRQYVDSKLSVLAPDVLNKFSHAYERTATGDAEAYSQAAMMCRRVLKAVADIVYPGRSEKVTGKDGKLHSVTDQEYLNRLIQYLSESLESSTVRKAISSALEDLAKRLKTVNDLASKGDHSDISAAEVDLCVIQTYLLVGDILRVYEKAEVVSPEAGAES